MFRIHRVMVTAMASAMGMDVAMASDVAMALDRRDSSHYYNADNAEYPMHIQACNMVAALWTWCMQALW